MELVKLGLCLVFCIFNNYTDKKSHQIRNPAVLTFAALACCMQLFACGLEGLTNGLLGFLFPLCLFPLFYLRMLGAGDVKALMAIGAMVGFPLSLWTVCFSILGGGILALGILVFRGGAAAGARRFFSFIKGCFLYGRILPYSDELKIENGGFHFSYGITMGVSATLIWRAAIRFV